MEDDDKLLLAKMDGKIDLMLQQQQAAHDSLQEVRRDLYTPVKGLFYKISGIITKVNLAWVMIPIMFSALIWVLVITLKQKMGG